MTLHEKIGQMFMNSKMAFGNDVLPKGGDLPSTEMPSLGVGEFIFMGDGNVYRGAGNGEALITHRSALFLEDFCCCQIPLNVSAICRLRHRLLLLLQPADLHRRRLLLHGSVRHTIPPGHGRRRNLESPAGVPDGCRRQRRVLGAAEPPQR